MDNFDKAVRDAQAHPSNNPLEFLKARGHVDNQPRDKNGRWTNGSAHGARIDLVDNKDGSRTMYAGGKKETRGSHAEVEAHIARHGPGGNSGHHAQARVKEPAAAKPKKTASDPEGGAKDFAEAHEQLTGLGYTGSGRETHSWGGPHTTYKAPSGPNPKRTAKIEVHHMSHADSGKMEFRATVTVQHHNVASIRDNFSATFPTAAAANRAVQRGQRPIVLHLGDHDPSGVHMTEDNRDRLTMFAGVPVMVQRLALNYSQIEEFRPPENFAKTTDSRIEHYRDHMARCGGDPTVSWELDALDPTVVRDLIADAVGRLRDEEIWSRSLAQEVEDQRTMQDIITTLGEEDE